VSTKRIFPSPGPGPTELGPARLAAGLSLADRYHILRDQIQHEDNLTTQRLSWLLASQAFLFTGYAIVLNGPENLQNAFTIAQRDRLLTAIPGLGLFSALLIYVSIIAGIRALHHIHVQAQKIWQTCEPGEQGFPPIQGTEFTRMTGLASPVLVPPMFTLVWVWLILNGVAK
jgi:hypothetical protein